MTEAAALRERIGGEIIVYGSGRLTHALTEHNLVDDVRLLVYPFVVGEGRRLFGTTGRPETAPAGRPPYGR
jgi:dihydrofolate reductase